MGYQPPCREAGPCRREYTLLTKNRQARDRRKKTRNQKMDLSSLLTASNLFHGAVDRVARVVVAGGRLLALGHDLLV